MLAVSVAETLLGGREMLADVAQRGRTEDRVGDGVEQDIGVGMPVQPPIVRDLDPAEDQTPSRREAMSVVADAGPHWSRGRLRTMTSLEQGVGHGNVLCTGHFEIRRGRGDHRHWHASSLAKPCLICDDLPRIGSYR